MKIIFDSEEEKESFIDRMVTIDATNCPNELGLKCECTFRRRDCRKCWGKALEQQELERWIPVSERLPSREEYQANDGRFAVTDGNRTYAGLFDIYQNDFCDYRNPYIIDKLVTAWRPLPKPYSE